MAFVIMKLLKKLPDVIENTGICGIGKSLSVTITSTTKEPRVSSSEIVTE
jgi:hypothetical protein